MKPHKIKLTNKRLQKQFLEDKPKYKKVYITPSFDVKNRLQEFVAFDTETTGLNCEEDEIIQLSAVKYRNLKPVETWDTYLKPNCEISYEASLVNGITDEMVEDCPKINRVAKDFLEFVGDAPIVGYNVDFDLSFLWCSGIDLITGREIYDAYSSSFALFPKGTLPDQRLITVADALGITFNAHNSLEDSVATGEVLVKICEQYCRGEGVKIPMTSRDLKKQMSMDYDTQIQYLLEKYGPSVCDYFISEDNLTKNRGTSRTREGLECHHIDENIIPTLSDPDIASIYSYDYQRKDRLVYCNLLEHLLLHIKIGRDWFFENHKTMTVNDDLKELITHGVNMLSMQINRLYEDNGSNTKWEQNCFDVIQDTYKDYVSMLKDFQYYIIEHITGLTEFEKPVYVGRSFTDDETGETGNIIKVNKKEVVIEFEKELWTYEWSDFVIDDDLNEILEDIRSTLSETDYSGQNDKIYEDIQL